VFVILRTACSPRVASHPTSRRRSYLWLPGASISRDGTFTRLMAPAARRTRAGFYMPPHLKRFLVFFASSRLGEKKSPEKLAFLTSVPPMRQKRVCPQNTPRPATRQSRGWRVTEWHKTILPYPPNGSAVLTPVLIRVFSCLSSWNIWVNRRERTRHEFRVL